MEEVEVYKNVVEEVIKRVRDDFRQEGLEEQLVYELQTVWENKLFETGAIGPEAPTEANIEVKEEEGAVADVDGKRKASDALGEVKKEENDTDGRASKRVKKEEGDEDVDDDDGDEGLSDVDLDDEEDPDTKGNLVLAQYERVTRTKNKWKCVLRDGIMKINGRDWVFSKGMCDFDF
mmetsp:Transcript_1118/g.3924  ORF Transcript_1118/g.3924 Transcript_1118/m.3924 type:complete len:177 (+) Transcript_1118:386-916(+)